MIHERAGQLRLACKVFQQMKMEQKHRGWTKKDSIPMDDLLERVTKRTKSRFSV